MSEAAYQEARVLRNVILLKPIGIPDFGWERHDRESFHFIAEVAGVVVGCVVLFPAPTKAGSAQLMQMAVSAHLQGQGIGTGLVALLCDLARQRGFKEITCHSRDDAVGFYQGRGFEVVGESFEEVGVKHRHMRLPLAP